MLSQSDNDKFMHDEQARELRRRLRHVVDQGQPQGKSIKWLWENYPPSHPVDRLDEEPEPQPPSIEELEERRDRKLARLKKYRTAESIIKSKSNRRPWRIPKFMEGKIDMDDKREVSMWKRVNFYMQFPFLKPDKDAEPRDSMAGCHIQGLSEPVYDVVVYDIRHIGQHSIGKVWFEDGTVYRVKQVDGNTWAYWKPYTTGDQA